MSKKKTLHLLAEDELRHLAGLFKLLGEPMRLKILQSVCHEPLTVNEIVKAVGSTQANVSKHLALLGTAGILNRTRAGQCIYYGLKNQLVLRLCELVREQKQGA